MRKRLPAIIALLLLSYYVSSVSGLEYIPDSNTIALWHFNETGGLTVSDVSGKGNNGTATGTAVVPGKFGNARSFNGTSGDYIAVPYSSSLAPANQITIEGWFYIDSLTSNAPVLLDKRTAEGAANDYLLYYNPAQDSVRFEIGIGERARTVTFSWSGAGMALRIWYYIAASYDGSYIRLYLNGQLMTTVPASGSITYTNGALYFGRKYNNYYLHPFHGLIDEVRISRIARSASEIAKTWQDNSTAPALIPYAPNPTFERRPTLHWHAVDSVETYTIQIDTVSRFASPFVIIATSDTFFTPLADFPMTTIYWRVGAGKPLCYSAWSSVYIQSDTVPFLYAYKGADITDRRPAFAWKPVSRATAYRIEIDTARTFTRPGTALEVVDTIFRPLSDLEYRMYYWRVSCSLNKAAFSCIDSLNIIPDAESEDEKIALLKENLIVTPNPFNPRAVIRFLNTRHHATIVIMSIDGRILCRYENLTTDRFTWNAANAANGIYIVKLITGDQVSIKRMYLLK